MFMNCSSRKSWPAELVVKALGSFSPRTSQDPRLGLKVLSSYTAVLSSHTGIAQKCVTLGGEFPGILESVHTLGHGYTMKINCRWIKIFQIGLKLCGSHVLFGLVCLSSWENF